MVVNGRILPRRAELRPMVRLAIPVVIIQVGMMAMGVVDTVMVGHVSAQALAAVALGNLYFFTLAVFALGTLMVLDPVVAQAVGARDMPAIARAVQRGIIIAALLTVPAVILLWLAAPMFGLLNQPAEVIPPAAAYAVRTAPGTFPFLLFVVFRQSLQAMGRTGSIVAAIVGANLANVALNWVMIFGHLGFPAMGVVGSAWATTISRVLLVAGLWIGARGQLGPLLLPIRSEVWQPRPLLRMLRLGVPIGAQHVLEFGAFALVALMMGWMGMREMAGHQIAINLAALTFMVPLGVGDAASVLVGRAVGRGDPEGARGAARAAFACGVTFMAVTGAIFLTLPHQLAGLYSRDVAVVSVAAMLIPIAGVFQVFDGTQVVAGGVLRGLGDTRAPMVANLIGYWLVGIPVSIYLGFEADLGPPGLWWGLVLGLGLVGASLLLRVRSRLRRRQARVIIDTPGLVAPEPQASDLA
ncbi:MAG TPA: MATE family efflux transporter [Gemmatimonadales bacterium]|nr:MATE family efflux transporter [Gemmatimonadales bacterium]